MPSRKLHVLNWFYDSDLSKPYGIYEFWWNSRFAKTAVWFQGNDDRIVRYSRQIWSWICESFKRNNAPNCRVEVFWGRLQAKPEKAKTRIVKHTTKSSALAGALSLYEFYSKINEMYCFFTGKAEMFVSIWSLVWEKTIWNHAGNELYENSQSQWSRRSTRAIKVIEYRYWRWIELMDRIDGSNCESNWCLKDPTQGFRE